ncbi:hypothetical protein DYQ86_12760 [Acidobacteria bacterium AB60]|nr:hypothetical protein DYQ86_12760 [Acidobacteria bacterium AB60]
MLLLASHRLRLAAFLLLLFVSLPFRGTAQDKPYFVTYSHDLEEPGNLEVETKSAIARPEHGHHFGALATELEYGARAWWTTELYLDGQTTGGQSTLFTGFRWENRFRPLMHEYAVNPVLYVEFENISAADKNVLEVVGHDVESDLDVPNAVARAEHQHEGELKLILSSNVHDWNISENFISEKNLGHAPWEFGYAVAVAHPLRAASSGRECTLCAEKFIAGLEAYGGLGDTWDLSLRQTSHYLAPVVGWQLPAHMRLSFSPSLGMTRSSMDQFYRVGFAYEFSDIDNKLLGHKRKGKVW